MSRIQDLHFQIEQAQVELRESIEHSRVLTERSDALIRQVKDQSLQARAKAEPAQGSSPPPP